MQLLFKHTVMKTLNIETIVTVLVILFIVIISGLFVNVAKNATVENQYTNEVKEITNFDGSTHTCKVYNVVTK